MISHGRTGFDRQICEVFFFFDSSSNVFAAFTRRANIYRRHVMSQSTNVHERDPTVLERGPFIKYVFAEAKEMTEYYENVSFYLQSSSNKILKTAHKPKPGRVCVSS